MPTLGGLNGEGKSGVEERAEREGEARKRVGLPTGAGGLSRLAASLGFARVEPGRDGGGSRGCVAPRGSPHRGKRTYSAHALGYILSPLRGWGVGWSGRRGH